MKKLLLLGFILLALGCATTMPDRVNRLETFDPKNQTIIIQSFDFNPDIATEVNKAFVSEFGKEIALDIKAYLHSKGYKKIKIDGDPNEGDYLIKGKITAVSGGNKHQRIWLGFGYGASIITVRGEILDLKKSETVFDYNITKKSNFTYSDNEAALRENLQEVAVELVDQALNDKPEVDRYSQNY